MSNKEAEKKTEQSQRPLLNTEVATRAAVYTDPSQLPCSGGSDRSASAR